MGLWKININVSGYRKHGIECIKAVTICYSNKDAIPQGLCMLVSLYMPFEV